MPAESHKAKHRFTDLLVGKGLDIGCGGSPVTSDCDQWDIGEGDAQYLVGAPQNYYDWILSSHLLEHIKDPTSAVAIWWRSLKPGGYMILLVPDEDLYEQGHWPSHFNSDHKHTFTASKQKSWSPVSKNLLDIVHALPGHKLLSLVIRDTNYDYTRSFYDQTSIGAEASVEMILRKEPASEIISWMLNYEFKNAS